MSLALLLRSFRLSKVHVTSGRAKKARRGRPRHLRMECLEHRLTLSVSPTSTAVAAQLANTVYGQADTFTATVASADVNNTSTPTGNVIFEDTTGATPVVLGTVALTSGTAAFTTSALAIGSHTVTAFYQGDASFAVSNGSASDTVAQAATTTALASSSNASVYGQSITLTASVSVNSPGAGTAGGSVQFLDGTTVLATRTLDATGTAKFSTNQLSVGAHSLTAVYQGSTNFVTSTSTATSDTVAQGTTQTVLFGWRNPTNYGQAVTLVAQVNPVSPAFGLRTGMVTFMDGTNVLGTGTLSKWGTASFTTSSLSVGTHSLTAVYSGDTNFAGSTSTALAEVVNKGYAHTTVITSAQPVQVGQSVTFTAAVGSSVAVAPTGSVEFLDNGAALGTVPLSGGLASFSTSTLTVGYHRITALYLGDANYNASSSPAVWQAVNATTQTATGTATGSGTLNNGAQTFTFVVQNPGNNHKQSPTGEVEFQDAAQNVNLLSDGIKSITVSADGNTITVTGSAAVNGKHGYSFTLTLVQDNTASTTSVGIQITGPGRLNYNLTPVAIDAGSVIQITNASLLASNPSPKPPHHIFQSVFANFGDFSRFGNPFGGHGFSGLFHH